MHNGQRFKVPFGCLAIAASLWSMSWQAVAASPEQIKVARFIDATQVELAMKSQRTTMHNGERFGQWTVMDVNVSEPRTVILEDFEHVDGKIILVDESGIRNSFAKTAESSKPSAALYLGRSAQEVLASADDLLGRQILDRPGDPSYAEVAAAFAPIRLIKSDTFAFVGTPDTFDKVGFTYCGRSPDFEPAVYQPSIEAVCKSGDVEHGLVGNYLPILRFVYPEQDAWTELIAFAPFKIKNDNPRIQPVWYRVARIEHGKLKWARYFDSYHPFSSQQKSDSHAFYRDLVQLKSGWDDILKAAMTIELPDTRMMNMARSSLIRAIMTRIQDFPKYGAVDRDYGGSEHDGFPDTFTAETTAMIEWGLFDRAARYVDNYLTHFVSDDGSILYRGPETAQFGRMLTVLAEFVEAGGSPEIILRHRKHIDAIANLLLTRRTEALRLPATDPAYGLISGWDEADSSLEKDPSRYLQPYFSNSMEAVRGFREIGNVWMTLGANTHDAELTSWGERLTREASALRKDVDAAISRSLLSIDGNQIIPAVASAKEPFDVAVRRDIDDPQFRAYRTYNEMMYSGLLSRAETRSIINYRSTHHDVILGMPAAYNKAELAGFLSYGFGYGLIQHDMIREALLMLYSDMAHQYTRGMWVAPETVRPILSEEAAPYCTPAQLVVPLMTRWLLAFEDSASETLWLGKALPREWLADGNTISATNVPTRWGKVSYSIHSHVKARIITAHITVAANNFPADIKLRLRAPNNLRMKSVTLNGKRWKSFGDIDETVTIPSQTANTVDVVVNY